MVEEVARGESGDEKKKKTKLGKATKVSLGVLGGLSLLMGYISAAGMEESEREEEARKPVDDFFTALNARDIHLCSGLEVGRIALVGINMHRQSEVRTDADAHIPEHQFPVAGNEHRHPGCNRSPEYRQVVTVTQLNIGDPCRRGNLRLLLGKRLKLVLATPSSIHAAIKNHFGLGAETIQRLRGERGVVEDPQHRALDACPNLRIELSGSPRSMSCCTCWSTSSGFPKGRYRGSPTTVVCQERVPDAA